MIAFALAIFLGAFLLFQVQPLMGRYILPWFGGASSVWTTCLLFFQVSLLVGYGYAHWLSRRLKPGAHGWVHLALLAVSLTLLPIAPGPWWKPSPDDEPVGRILLLLVGTIGVPFVLLASTGPLMQHWFSRSQPDRSPYRLYALSNAASLLALVSYPVLVEPTLTLAGQTTMWSWAYVLFTLAAGWCAVIVIVGRRRAAGSPDVPAAGNPIMQPGEGSAPDRRRALPVPLWLGLAAAGSAMLMATTNKLTQEVASVPFLWVVPLSIYLLTFVICFDREQWYVRWVFGSLLAVMGALTVALLLVGNTVPFWPQLVIYTGVLFASCMTCHGELMRSRPPAVHLTLFYLMVAAGGVLGGVFVVLIAPLVFQGFWELHLALGTACLLGMVAGFRDPDATPDVRRLVASYVGVAGLLLLVGGIALVGDYRPWFGIDLAGWSEIQRRGVTVWEMHWPYLLLAATCAAAVLLAASKDLTRVAAERRPIWYRPALRICVAALGVALVLHVRTGQEDAIHAARNFYGMLRVVDRGDSLTDYRALIDGSTAHGRQFLSEEKRGQPIAYYDPASGVGMVLDSYARNGTPNRSPDGIRVGIVGLGAGTLAAYGRPGDVFRFYEINPAVAQVAGRYFTYLEDSDAQVEIVLGDGRIRLEEELRRGESQEFDLLVIDAFTSDAIPVHLLTEQSTALYLQHLKENGLLLFHVSNRYVNLRPVIRGLARRFGFQGVWIQRGGRVDPGVLGSSWLIVGKPGNPIFTEDEIARAASPFPFVWEPVGKAATSLGVNVAEIERRITAGQLGSTVRENERLVWVETDPSPVLWTDDRSSLWPLLRLR